MQTDQTNIINNLTDLFQNTKVNNQGEAYKSSSSSSSFNNVLKELFPHPPPNTSPEDGRKIESSPDYFSDKETPKESQEQPQQEATIKVEEPKARENPKEEPKELKEDSKDVPVENAQKQDNKKENVKTDKTNESESEKSEKSKNKTTTEEVNKTDNVTENAETSNTNKVTTAETEAPSEVENTPETEKNNVVSKLFDLLKDLVKLLQQYFGKNQNTAAEATETAENAANNNANPIAELAKNGEFQQLKDLFKQIKDLLADQPNVNQGQFIKDLLNKLKEEGSEDLPINKILEFFKNNDINLEDLKNEFTFEDPKEENILDTILNYIKENTAENENPITDLEDDGVLQTAITNAVIQNVKNKAENSQNNLGTEIIPDKTTKQNNTSLFTPEETKDSEKQPLFEKEVNVSIKNNANANIQPIKDNVLNLKTNQDASQANVNANNNTLDKVIDTAIQNAQTVKPEAAADKAAQTQSLNSTPQKSDTTLQNLESKLNQVEEKAPQADKVKNTPMASYLSKAFNAEREIIDRIVTQANMRLNGANKEINFNLTPPELGKVRVSITDIEGVISGKIQVENDVIKEIVQSNLAQLRTSLTQSIKIDKLEVEVRDSTADLKQQGSAWNKGESDAGAKENNQSSEHNRYYSNNTEEVFGIKIPAPKGVNIKSDGLVTVDLIG